MGHSEKFVMHMTRMSNIRCLTSHLGFLKENPGLTPHDNAMAFLSDDGGETYNRCHCTFSSFPAHLRVSHHRRVRIINENSLEQL